MIRRLILSFACLAITQFLPLGYFGIAAAYENHPENSLFLRWPNVAPGSHYVSYQRWRIANSIIHFANHIYNNYQLAKVVLEELLEEGIPSQIVNGKFRERISPEELRASYQIPEEFWQNVGQRQVLKDFVYRFLLTMHDDAKLNTSDAFFLKHYPPTPLGQDGRNTFIIEHLHQMFGSNPWKIPEGANADLVQKYHAAQSAIRLLNAIDGQVTTDFFSRRSEISPTLGPDWVALFVLKLEKTVDNIERWGNPYSELELNRPTLAESKFEIKMGQISERQVSNRNTNVKEFPHRRLVEHLEKRYHEIAHPYEKFYQSTEIFFAQLSLFGIEEQHLHPIKKYQLLWILQNGERRPPAFDHDFLAFNLFEKAGKIREIFLPTAAFALRDYDVMTIKHYLKQEKFVLLKKSLFDYLSLADFLHFSNGLQFSEWRNLFYYLQYRGNTNDLELFHHWSSRRNNHSIPIWMENFSLQKMHNYIDNCFTTLNRLHLIEH